MKSGLFTITITGALLVLCSCSIPEQGAISFQPEDGVEKILLDQQIPLTHVIATVRRTTPESTEQAMFKFQILARAGLHEEAADTLRLLKRLNVDPIDLSFFLYDLNTFEDCDINVTAIEIFADEMEIANVEGAWKHLTNAGWTFEQIDAWMADMPSRPDYFWTTQRVHFHAAHGNLSNLINTFRDAARAEPGDSYNTQALLHGLFEVCMDFREFVDTLDLHWVAEKFDCKSALRLATVADRLKFLEQWEPAAVFYAKAMNYQLTKEEVQQLEQQFVSPDRFAADLRDSMATCMFHLSRYEDAQCWMEQAVSMQRKSGLYVCFSFAGGVESSSGQKTIEAQIINEEEIHKDDPEYWFDRAEYYAGCSRFDKREEALLAGLALTDSCNPADSESKCAYWRTLLYSRFIEDLRSQGRDLEADVWTCKEIERLPASEKRRAVGLLTSMSGGFDPHNPLFWERLAECTEWTQNEQFFLSRIFAACYPGELDDVLQRAEKMAIGHHPSRAQMLGEAMCKMDLSQEAIPVLQYAVASDDTHTKKNSAAMLIDCCLEGGKWEQAEDVLPVLRGSFLMYKLPRWYSATAVLAAKSGDKTAALRIWKRMANYSPYYLKDVKTLADYGLKKEITAFYRQMQKELPDSDIPARAFAVLQN